MIDMISQYVLGHMDWPDTFHTSIPQAIFEGDSSAVLRCDVVFESGYEHSFDYVFEVPSSIRKTFSMSIELKTRLEDMFSNIQDIEEEVGVDPSIAEIVSRSWQATQNYGSLSTLAGLCLPATAQDTTAESGQLTKGLIKLMNDRFYRRYKKTPKKLHVSKQDFARMSSVFGINSVLPSQVDGCKIFGIPCVGTWGLSSSDTKPFNDPRVLHYLIKLFVEKGGELDPDDFSIVVMSDGYDSVIGSY